MILEHLMVVDWAVFLLAFAVIVVAAVAQSTIGVGFGIVSAPILAIMDPALVPGPLLVLAALTSFGVLIRDRRNIRFGALGYALVGRVIFSLAGALVASLLPQHLFLLVFAALILLAVAISLAGVRVEPTRRSLFVAGSASGFMGTITSVGTPPMAIVYQYAPGAEVRANMSAFLTIGALVSVGSLAVFGEFGWPDLLISLKLVPALLVGFWLSRWLTEYTDRGWMRPAMLVLCAAAAAVLLVRGVDALMATA